MDVLHTPHRNLDSVLGYGVVEQLNCDLQNPLNFDCPSIVVNTDNGYQPALEAIIAQIDSLYSRPSIHDLDRASYV